MKIPNQSSFQSLDSGQAKMSKIKSKNKKITLFNIFLPKTKGKKRKRKGKKQNWEILDKDCFLRALKLKSDKIAVLALILVMLFEFIGFPSSISADEAIILVQKQKIGLENGAVLSEKEADLLNQGLIIVEHLPKNEDLLFVNMGIRLITAYSSTVDQTDGSPCITANGFNVCKHGKEDTIAANFLKFGTKVRVPELYGDKIFVVRDRMNKRFPNRVDIWMTNRYAAQKFGVQYAKVEIVVEESL